MSTSVSTSYSAGTPGAGTSASNSSSAATLSADAIIGIVVGSVFALAILAGLAITLIRRRLRRSGFERVDNPRQLRGGMKGLSDKIHGTVTAPPRTRDNGSRKYMSHSQQLSVEPLLPTTPGYSPSRIRSPRSPFQQYSDAFVAPHVELGVIQGEYDPYAEINDSPVLASRGGTPVQTTPVINWKSSPQSSSYGDDVQTYKEMEEANWIASGTRPRTPLFINRTLKKYPSETQLATVTGHIEQTASLPEKNASDLSKIRLPESALETHITEGKLPILAQPVIERPLIPPAGPTPIQPVARSPRKMTRTRTVSSGFSGALAPVAETPDPSQVLNSIASQRPLSIISSESHHDSIRERSSLLSGNVSHDVKFNSSSEPMDEKPPIPLLASTSFGRGIRTPTPTSSNSSNLGCNTHSGSSRYPSLAASSLGQCSGSQLQLGGHTDWHHPPSGLAGLKDLQIQPLKNPHSPVESVPPRLPTPDFPPPSRSDTLKGGDARKRAHLRENTSSFVPEVQRRIVSQGGIATIDVAL